MKLYVSGENYLETIYILSKKKPQVRSIDIVNELHFSKPSISRAMSLLRENGYVVMDDVGLLTLTPAGMEVASRIYERHRLLTQWLIQLGVDPKIAAEDACKIEHDLRPETFEALKRHSGLASKNLSE